MQAQNSEFLPGRKDYHKASCGIIAKKDGEVLNQLLGAWTGQSCLHLEGKRFSNLQLKPSW